MKPGRCRQVPASAALLLACAAALLVSGCIGAPDLEASGDPVVVTETGVVSYAPPQSPERRAAVAEMRAQAVAGETMPYPDVFQTVRNTQLATRAEPISVADVRSIELELAAIARRRQAATSPAEIAALQARAEELRRLAAQAAAVRAQRP